MKIGIIGCAGRMGRALLDSVSLNENAELSGGLEHQNSKLLGVSLATLCDNAPNDSFVTADIDKLLDSSDAVIEFTSPAATIEHLQATTLAKVPHIIGTTGMTQKELSKLEKAAKDNVIIHSHNFSLGVNILMNLVQKTAALLPPEQFDIEVLEMHHNQKVDSPSGTALSLGQAAADGRNTTLEKDACYDRVGQVGKRPTGEIGFATLRGGNVVGDHSVIFASNKERITLSHQAQDRTLFADGAVHAAIWSHGRDAGLYDMQDVIADI